MRQHSFNRKKMAKQLTGKRDDTPLHLAARSGNLQLVMEIISEREDAELKELLCKQNHSGETALYVAVECGFVDIVKEMMKCYDISMAAIKAKNGYDAFHVASKQGNLGKSLPKVFKIALWLFIMYNSWHPMLPCLLFQHVLELVYVSL